MRDLLQRRGPVALLLVTVALALGACGDDDGAGDGPPDPSDIPSNAVAIVGDQTVTQRDYERAAAAVRRRGDTSRQTKAQVRQQVMALVLYEAALEEEARERGVSVRAEDVRARIASARTQFGSERKFKRFLGGQTEADLYSQLRLQALSEEIDEQVSEDGGDLKKFRSDFPQKSMRQTVCRKGYVVSSCGNSETAAP